MAFAVATYSQFILAGLIFITSVVPLEVTKTNWENFQETLEGFLQDPVYDDEALNYTKVLVSSGSSGDVTKFPCEVFHPGPVPDSVHKLHPGHISVIGAMGDSITAGNGITATTVVGVLDNNRGLSWDVGGQETYEKGSTTVPNILKHYNPRLTGFSTGTGIETDEVARLNVAVVGSYASGVPAQARMLVERLKSMEGVDFDGHWKLLTLFIGGNDLCDICKDESHSADSYVGYIQEALDYLLREVPRAFVNVVAVFDVTPVANLSNGIVCTVLHQALCPCGMDENWQETIQQTVRQYSRKLRQLIAGGRYNTKKDFTVVFQPFMRDLELPTKPDGSIDFSYFAPDCFHFDYKTHNLVAVWLWNAMFVPVGKKPTISDYDAKLYCPKQDEYLATWVNSKLDHPFQDDEYYL